MEASGNAQGPPTPDPALRALDPFVGTWSMKGHLIGSDDENIVGQSTFRWLDGGFFLLQDVELDFAGLFEVNSPRARRLRPRDESLLLARLLQSVALPAAVQVGGPRRRDDHLGQLRPARCDLQPRDE